MHDPEGYEEATKKGRSDQKAIDLGALQDAAPEADGKYG
jgi:hypothetical protein